MIGVEMVAQLLERDEREAVLGDLCEGGDGPWEQVFAVTGLVVRREGARWRDWRPWVAAVGLALPCTFLLMGFSVFISRGFVAGMSAGLVRNAALLAAWAWTCGFAVSTLSRRTLWVSASLSFAPCFFCLQRFRIESLPRMCLLVFVPAAIWGVRKGFRSAQIGRGWAVVLAVGVTVLMLPIWNSSGIWLPNWALCWPAWYLVARTSRRDPSHVSRA